MHEDISPNWRKYSYTVHECYFPNIKYPKGFNYKLYANIQYELANKFEYYLTNNIKGVPNTMNPIKRMLMSRIEFNPKPIEKFCDSLNFSNDENIVEYNYCIVYDRSRLKHIVEKLSSSIGENKEQAKKLTK